MFWRTEPGVSENKTPNEVVSKPNGMLAANGDNGQLGVPCGCQVVMVIHRRVAALIATPVRDSLKRIVRARLHCKQYAHTRVPDQ